VLVSAELGVGWQLVKVACATSVDTEDLLAHVKLSFDALLICK